jgi:Na+-transporting methylmalonyl-CoA/oxaloacetate decarboxylase gamma subunit
MDSVLSIGLSTTILGMGITFAGLILLWVATELLGKFNKAECTATQIKSSPQRTQRK